MRRKFITFSTYCLKDLDNQRFSWSETLTAAIQFHPHIRFKALFYIQEGRCLMNMISIYFHSLDMVLQSSGSKLPAGDGIVF